MCDPITIGLTLASAAANYVGNKQAENATKRSLALEQQRQGEKTRQQEQVLDQSYNEANKLKDPNAQQDAVDNRRASFIQALNTRPATQEYLPGQDSAPRVVQDTADKANAGQRAYSEGQAGALANLTGFGDQLFGTNIKLGRNSQQIGQLGSDKANSAAALDAELRADQYKGGTMRGLGQLFGALSVGRSLAGGAGGTGAAGKAASLARAPGWSPFGDIMVNTGSFPVVPIA